VCVCMTIKHGSNQLGHFNGARMVGVNFIKGAQLCLV
jgi:hypothetical protein